MKFNKKHWIIVSTLILVIIAVIGIDLTSNRIGTPVSGVASISLIDLDKTTVEVGDLQNISWKSFNYGAPTVAINIIRKVADNPARYELVRTVSAATLNDGSAVWVPAKTDIGSNIIIEVGCTLSAQECHASQSQSALAIVDTGRFSNTANTYKAIEQLNNK